MIVNSWEIRRGRSYELDKNSPGSATVTIIDTTGEVDPTSSAYSFNPGTPAAITLTNPVTSTDHTVFRGWIASLSYDMYPTEQYAVATLELVDGLDKLGNIELMPGDGFLFDYGDRGFIEATGDVYYESDDNSNAVANRINKILDEAGWPSGLREVFSGNVSLQRTIYAYRTPLLTGILDAADAEFPGVANFYIQKDGRATFHGRLARFHPTDAQYHISIRRAGDIAAVTSDPTRALIFSLDIDKDMGRVINSAIATAQGTEEDAFSTQRVEDTASITSYGTRAISFDNLVTKHDYLAGVGADAAVKKFADYYVDNFAQPLTRVNRIGFRGLDASHSNAAVQWQLLCNVDISDIIRLKTTHQQGGFNDVDLYVEGLTMRKGPHPIDVELELDVSPRAHYNVNPWA